MALIRWNPSREFDHFFDEEWGAFPYFRELPAAKFPRMDVYQTDKDVIVEMEVPTGIDPEKVDIAVEGETLTVKGASEEKKEEKDKHYYRREIRKGAFERSIMLPAAVKGGQAEATYEKGVLKITIPKIEVEKIKKVSVKVKK